MHALKTQSWSLAEAQQHCLAMARREPQNNDIAYWYLGRSLRPHVATLYCFQRSLLDMARQPNHAQRLSQWEESLVDCFRGRAEHPIFVSLRETATLFDMPITPFQDLITGARMSVTQRRFTSFNALMTLVEKVGHPLGRLILLLARDQDVDHIRAANDIATAMTLNSFWAHLDEDFKRGVLYIPQEDLLRFGVSESDLTQQRISPAFRELMEFQVSRTRMYLMRGRPLCSVLPESLQTEIQLVWFIVNVALDNILADGCDVFTKTHALRPVDWVRATARLSGWRLKEMTQW